MPPWLIFAALASLTLALLYEFASRRFGWRLLWYWLVIGVCFIAAEAAAESLGLNITRFGDLRLLPDFAGAFAGIGLLWFLGV